MTRLTPVSVSAASLAALVLVAPAVGRDAVEHAAPPPIRVERDSGAFLPDDGKRAATTEYSHGDPTDDEQLFLELMNRARMDPAAEGDRILVDYDLNQIRSAVEFFLDQRPGVEWTRQENHDAFDALPAAQPLAFNALLSSAARKHTDLMQLHDEQSHWFDEQGEERLGARVTAEGYLWGGLGESIFINAKSMLHAHGAFAVDWGQGIDGGTGRPATGHRDSLMSVAFSECGIGVLDDDDAGTQAGPQLITIDFGAPLTSGTSFVTGVVYDDTNGNAFYDPGEGIPGVRIETDESEFFAISSASGGYAVPVASNAGQITVFAGGQAGTPSEAVGSQQVRVTMAGQNVKVDFGPSPEPPIPMLHSFEGATGSPIADGTTWTDVVPVGVLDEGDGTVGDVRVLLELDHADRSEIRVSLTSPAGTEVVLFDGAPGGEDLFGIFDTTLHPAEPLAAFVGEASQGAWTLRVTDAAGGVTDGELDGWTLLLRPGWIRPLHAPQTTLAVKTLKVKDSPKPGKDKVILKADVDIGGNTITAEPMGVLRLVDAATGDEYLAVAIPDPTGEPDPEAPTVKAKLDFSRSGSSRTTVTLKVSGFDLPGSPLPATTRVEIALGGAIVSEDVSTASGKSTGVAGRRFFVDSVKSKAKGDSRSSLVKGRFAAAGALGTVEGVVEVVVGDARFRFDASELVAKTTKLQYKSGAGLRKLVVDTRKGTFSMKVDGAHEIAVNGGTPVELRLGGAFFGTARVAPYEKGTKTLY